MDRNKQIISAIITIIVILVGVALMKNTFFGSNKLSDRVTGTYTAEYDITYMVEEVLEKTYNVDIQTSSDVYFNANMRFSPDGSFSLTFDTNSFNEQLLDYCVAAENDAHINIDEYQARSVFATYLTDLFKEASGSYEVDDDVIRFSGNTLPGLIAYRRSNSRFRLEFNLTDGTEFLLYFEKN